MSLLSFHIYILLFYYVQIIDSLMEYAGKCKLFSSNIEVSKEVYVLNINYMSPLEKQKMIPLFKHKHVALNLNIITI